MKTLFCFLLLLPVVSFSQVAKHNGGLSTTAGDTRYVNAPSETVAQTFTGAVTVTSSFTVTGATGEFGVRISSNIYTVGYSSASTYYGGGANLTSLTAANISAGTFGAGVLIPAAGVDLSTVTTNHVLKAGDTMTGQLTISGSSLTITGTGGYGMDGYRILRGSETLAGIFVGSGAGIVNTGANNTFAGYNAGNSNTTAASGVFLGFSSGYLNTTGTNNTFLGFQSGYSNTTGNSNTFVGFNTGNTTTGGTSNAFLGAQAGLSNTTGDSNVFLGVRAGYYNQTSANNVVVGFEAGGYLSGAVNSFANSTFVGYKAGNSITTGGNNILVGYQAGDVLTTGTANIIIGYDIDPVAATTSNSLNIGGLITGDLSSATKNVVVSGTMSVTGNAFSVGGSTLVVTGGQIGIGTKTPDSGLHISSRTLKLDGAGALFNISVSSTITTATDSCVTGDIRWDASYIFVCTATSAWKRSALSSW